MNIYFTSDQHYGHANVIKFCNRPFSSVDDMTEQLIENHNKVVRKGDLVYNLGDMFWRTLSVGEAISIVKRLNGQQYYIFGNHDELFRNKILQQQFVWCKDVHNLKVDGYPHMWLSHYAHEDWNGSHRGSYNLFGHVHGAKPDPVGLKMDVGVDIRNYTPISIDEVHAVLSKKAEKITTRYWSCESKECKNRFNAVDEAPKICSKCGSSMKLMKKVIG